MPSAKGLPNRHLLMNFIMHRSQSKARKPILSLDHFFKKYPLLSQGTYKSHSRKDCITFLSLAQYPGKNLEQARLRLKSYKLFETSMTCMMPHSRKDCVTFSPGSLPWKESTVAQSRLSLQSCRFFKIDNSSRNF